MRLIKSIVFLLSTVILIVGCGDEGDDSGSNNSSSLNSTPIAITADNGQNIAAGTVDTFEAVVDGPSSATDLVTGVDVNNTLLPVAELVIVLATRELIEKNLTHDGFVGPTGISFTVNCSGGGTASANLSGSDNDLDQGDVVTYTLNNCSEDGNVLNGSIVYTFNTLQGDFENDSTDWTMIVDFQANSFSASGGNESYTLDGDFTLSASYVQSSGTSTVSMQGSKLTYIENSDTAQLTDFVLAVIEDSAIQSNYTVSYDFVYTGSDIDGRVTVETMQDFVGQGENPPESGKAKITGANGSNVVIEATGSGMVKLSIDADGDGDFNDPGDTIITGQWETVFSE